MATKKEMAVKRAFSRGKKQGKVREEKHVLGFLTALVLILLYLLLAQHSQWWPYSKPKLGSAFFTNVSASTPAPSSSTTGSGSGSSGSSGSTGTSGSNGTSSGGSGSSGSSGSSTTSGGSTPIATFAAGVNVGDTQAQTSAQASGLSQNCAVVVSANVTDAGQQQVCTYTEGNKIVTVTYLNDHVISASKSGF